LLLEDISGLLGESLTEVRVSSDLGSETLITRQDVVLALN
jgi:hypothetical protein